jgi:hypothetical protein
MCCAIGVLVCIGVVLAIVLPFALGKGGDNGSGGGDAATMMMVVAMGR